MTVAIPGDPNTFNTTITAPTGGDARNAASVATPLEQLANRTAFLKNRLDNGVKRIRQFDDLAELKAATGLTDGEHCFVRDDDYFGLYEYQIASTTPQSLPWIVVPDAPTPGRYFHSCLRLIDYNTGAPRAAVKPTFCPKPLAYNVSNGTPSITATSWTTILTLSVTLAVDDLVSIDATVDAWMASSPLDASRLTLFVERPDTTEVQLGTYITAQVWREGRTLTRVYEAAAAGAHIFKLKGLVLNGSDTLNINYDIGALRCLILEK